MLTLYPPNQFVVYFLEQSQPLIININKVRRYINITTTITNDLFLTKNLSLQSLYKNSGKGGNPAILNK